MKFRNYAIALGLTAAGLGYTSAAQAQKMPVRDINISRAMQSPQLRRAGAAGIALPSPAGAMKAKPTVELGPTRSFYDIDGPDGKLWYCATELGMQTVNYDSWTDYILQEYWFTIYDSEFREVGRIHDKMRYADDEVRVPGPDQGISVLPVVTSHFFNTDDKYEIVVALAVNAGPGVNHYRSMVYSLGGPTETTAIWRDGAEVTETVDKAVGQYDGFIVDVLDASADGREEFYITFSDEFGPDYDLDFYKLMDGDEAEGQKFWEMLSTGGQSYRMYGPAGASGKPEQVFAFDCTYQQMQGDQESTPPMLTFVRDGQGYALCPHYKDTFYNPYYSPWDDSMSMRQGNALIVDLYKIGQGRAEKVNSIEVPAEKSDKEAVLATYYSVGSLDYSADVMFDAQGSPMYVVTRSNYLSTTDDNTDFCYYLYDAAGAKKTTIFEDADSRMAMTSLPGQKQQVMFVSYDDFKGYAFNFVNLLDGYGPNTVTIPALLDTGYDDPETLLANVDRVAIGDGYMYAFEMKVPLTDENYNTYMRVAWFNADGTFDRIDHVNMGQNVMYSQCWIDGTILNPDLICAGPEHEYLILVKRGISDTDSSTQEELLVAQPANEDLEGGKTVLSVGPGDKGQLRAISLYYPEQGVPGRLFVSYADDEGRYSVEFYDLPLPDTAGIENVAADSEAQIAYDGLTVAAPGQINVYDLHGALMATGHGSLSCAGLQPGIYVAVSGKSSLKINVTR